ncbi:flagellar basal body L-ring protein FlgH [Sphingomonas sp. PAMC 26605]|uniref:flagellar basal body L-ring protein FlgH n=1 Tax=Sphingomonas sp. PAMC 26605 TaxID=1112214 RepID=UPI00026CD6B7|nr:flagellar basal body L-ring protein FlgH [Sphingomonas sp. PAMC 26605]
MNKPALLLVVALAAPLAGCGAVGRLKAIGKPPAMSELQPPEAPDIEASLGSAGGTQQRAWAAPPATPATPPPAQTASLFRPGAGAFLSDQRASRLGDILTIKINIADKADIGNSTTRSRTGSENSGAAALLGLHTLIAKALPGSDPAKLVSTNSDSENKGSGTISRSETIAMTMSAIVTRVLPNGNLLIRGRQEVRVNFELRELIITGIVRPQDIARDNSVNHTQIAEARISYGGKGQLTDAQQARWGQQIYDALFPF